LNFVPEKWIRFSADSALLSEDVGSQTHLALVNNTNNRRRDTALKIDEVNNRIQREKLPSELNRHTAWLVTLIHFISLLFFRSHHLAAAR
jgi:hypothetical protein